MRGKDTNLPSSYTPIKLSLSKHFENVLLSKISPFLHENGKIPSHQIGFRDKLLHSLGGSAQTMRMLRRYHASHFGQQKKLRKLVPPGT